MYFTVVIYFYTCISSFADTFSCYKNGSSLEHIRERIAVFLITQAIDPKEEFYFE
jgi:hypothetical protein